jgi:hypothetical protein
VILLSIFYREWGKKVKEAKPFGRAGMGRKTQAKNGGEGCILFIDRGDIVE